MTLGGTSTIKTIFHKQERKLVEDHLRCLKEELKHTKEFKDDLTQNPRYIQIRAQIEILEKLLGKRL